jgi:hypothetical protein
MIGCSNSLAMKDIKIRGRLRILEVARPLTSAVARASGWRLAGGGGFSSSPPPHSSSSLSKLSLYDRQKT